MMTSAQIIELIEARIVNLRPLANDIDRDIRIEAAIRTEELRNILTEIQK